MNMNGSAKKGLHLEPHCSCVCWCNVFGVCQLLFFPSRYKMGKTQRPKSTSTSSSKTSGTTASGSVPYTDSLRSQCSSLEDALVQEYIKEINRGSPSTSQRLPR